MKGRSELLFCIPARRKETVNVPLRLVKNLSSFPFRPSAATNKMLLPDNEGDLWSQTKLNLIPEELIFQPHSD